VPFGLLLELVVAEIKAPHDVESRRSSDCVVALDGRDAIAERLDDGGGEVSSSGAPEMPPTPYQGGWDIGGCQSEVTGATDDPGGAISDFSFTDQFGETVRLYDFCHKAVLIVEGAFW
jgi:hypothetical protein